MMENNFKKILSDYSKEFFGNKFLLRLSIWVAGMTIFLFSLAGILVSNIGFSTYDTLWSPFRILVEVNDPAKYGLYILAPVGTILSIFTFIITYIWRKKIRIDYLLAMIPITVSSFILDKIIAMDFFDGWLKKTSNVDWPMADQPLAILISFISIPFFAISIGMMTACKIMPNPYAVLVSELSLKYKKSFRWMQYFCDGVLVALGLLITIINIYTSKKDGPPGFEKELSWPFALHYIGITTAIIVLTQGYLINLPMKILSKYF